MKIFFAILAFGMCAYAVVGIFWRHIGAVWRGSQVKLGLLSNIGVALVFGSAGIGMFGNKEIAILMLAGFLFVFVGFALDYRKRKT